MAENDPKGMAPDPRRTQRKVWTPDSAESAQADPRATQRKVWTPETSEKSDVPGDSTRATQRMNQAELQTKATERMKPATTSDKGDGKMPRKKKPFPWLAILIVVLLLAGAGAAGWFFMNRDSSPRHIDDEDDRQSVELPALDEYERPQRVEVLEYYNEADEEQPLIEVEEQQEAPQKIAIVDEPRNNEIRTQEEKPVRAVDVSDESNDINGLEVRVQGVVEQPRASDPEKVYTLAMVEQKPSFPGGDAAMYKWLAEHINYPTQAAEEGVQGRVVVTFDVQKDGSIKNVKIARGRHPALDKEAIRIVKAMPKWSPGRNNGQPVTVTYTLPVTFKLQN